MESRFIQIFAFQTFGKYKRTHPNSRADHENGQEAVDIAHAQMQIFQTFENQHGRNHHAADRGNKRHPGMQGFVRIHFALTTVKAVQAAIILRLQFFGIKVRLIINLGIVRHFGGVFDFFRFTQGLKKLAVLFFIGFLLQFDAFQRIAGPRVVIQNIFLDS